MRGSNSSVRWFTSGMAIVSLGLAGCADTAPRAMGWEGAVDTLPGGRVAVQNLGRGAWPEGGEWRVTEDLRIGSVDEEGPTSFGSVASMDVDPLGRLWVIDGQASEIRVFGADGRHVRTIGRRGEGPGEFTQPVRIDRTPHGLMWVMDPRNGRVSVFDTAGVYVEGLRAASGFVTFPWRGGFDADGRYYAPVIVPDDGFRLGVARFDAELNLFDTLSTPTDPVSRQAYRIEEDGLTRVSAGVPFQGGMQWRRSRAGTIWALITDRYEMFEFSPRGDTLRISTMPYDPLPVTRADISRAVEDLEWFTKQGGRVDRSLIPDHKPAALTFFLDDQDHLWVARTTADVERGGGNRFDIFGPDGRYLGRLETPFEVRFGPVPFERDGALYAVTRNELDVPFVVRARIERP